MPLLNRFRSLCIQASAALRISRCHLPITSEWDTLTTIRKNRASMARFGDGELMLMLGHGIYFQEHDPELADRLRMIVQRPSEAFLIGLPPFDSMRISKDKWVQAWARYRRLFSFFVQSRGCYHSAAVSRPAMVKDLSPVEFYTEVATLWEDRDVIMVGNEAVCPDHPMLRGARSVRHVECLREHAFRDYPGLLKRASAEYAAAPDAVILIAAGPTACVLAWDLAQAGAQALDVGHMMSGYDQCVAAESCCATTGL